MKASSKSPYCYCTLVETFFVKIGLLNWSCDIIGYFSFSNSTVSFCDKFKDDFQKTTYFVYFSNYFHIY